MLGMPKVLLCILILIGLSGCTLYPPKITPYGEATKHYQTTNRFDRIAVSVEVANTDGLVQPENLAKSVTEAIAEYLEQNEIQYVSESDAISQPTARLALLVSPTTTAAGTEYSILARLTATDGALIDETPLFHLGRAESDDVLAQYLASTVVDDMLLLWYPSAAAGKYLASRAGPAEYTLLANDPAPQTLAGVTRVSWEPFPSPRLLSGAGVSAKDISNVSYELRVHKPRLRVVPGRFVRTSIYRQKDIVEPWFDFPFLLPSCDYIVWSVRAHFTLAGQKRVTEWSGDYSTMYNGMSDFRTTHILFTPQDFLARLAALVPRPRANLTRYHGVFAPNSPFRRAVAPGSVNPARKKRKKPTTPAPAESAVDRDSPTAPLTWAQRLKRVFEIDITVCPHCGGTLRFIADVTDPEVIRTILEHLQQRAPPGLSPRRALPVNSQADIFSAS